MVTSEFRKLLRLEYGWWRFLHVGLATLGFASLDELMEARAW